MCCILFIWMIFLESKKEFNVQVDGFSYQLAYIFSLAIRNKYALKMFFASVGLSRKQKKKREK